MELTYPECHLSLQNNAIEHAIRASSKKTVVFFRNKLRFHSHLSVFYCAYCVLPYSALICISRVHPTELKSIVSGASSHFSNITNAINGKVVTRSSDKLPKRTKWLKSCYTHHANLPIYLFISIASVSLAAVRSQLGTLFTILNEMLEFCRRNKIKTILVCQK